MMGLTISESQILRDARTLIARKPDEVLRYLAGDQPPTKALVALALSAQLEVTKAKLESMKVTMALCEFLKVGEEKQDEVDGEQ
jgi:hypothetical protein